MKNETTEHFWHFSALFGGDSSNLGPFCPKIVLVTPNFFFDKLLIYLKIDISAKFHEDPMKNEVVRASQSWKKSSEGVNVDERPLCFRICSFSRWFSVLLDNVLIRNIGQLQLFHIFHTRELLPINYQMLGPYLPPQLFLNLFSPILICVISLAAHLFAKKVRWTALAMCPIIFFSKMFRGVAIEGIAIENCRVMKCSTMWWYYFDP